ncbi:MAG TPA: signal peptidase II [Thermoleophilia bacterium]|jgi:signal peptidase II
MTRRRPFAGPRGRFVLKWLILVASAGIAVGLDLLTKSIAEAHLVLGETHKILPFLYLQRTANTGVAFGLLGGRGSFIIVANVIAILVVIFYVVMEKRPAVAGVGGGLIVGGSLGNMVQRLAYGEVTDYLKFPHWPNFNLADVFIILGIAVIFLGVIVEGVHVVRAGRKGASTS